MTHTVVWEHHAMTEFRRLRQADPGGAKDCVAAVRGLADDQSPRASSALGGSGYYRLRVGDWRVLYRLDDRDRTVHVLKVGRVV